jgi:hypothetical protein
MPFRSALQIWFDILLLLFTEFSSIFVLSFKRQVLPNLNPTHLNLIQGIALLNLM